MDLNESLATLRHAFKCYGGMLHVAYSRPPTNVSIDTGEFARHRSSEMRAGPVV